MPYSPYTYRPTDNPVDLANQYGISPQQLYNANPGGYPFSAGQTINIPKAAQPQTFAQSGLFSAVMAPSKNPLVNPGLLPGIPQQTGGYHYQPHGAYGQSPSATGYNNPVIGSNGQPIGPHGTFGQTPNTTQPNIFQQLVSANSGQPTPNNYNVNQRGRGYGQPVINRGQMPDNVGNQQFYQEELTNVMNSTDRPVAMSSYTMQSLVQNGFDPAANGYVYQNGQWVQSGSTAETAATAAGTDTSSGGGQQSYDPRNIAYTWNKYAKNRHSTFQTNLKWAQNAWRRKKQNAKGGRPGVPRANPNGQNGQQPPQTGQNNPQSIGDISGFGLVDFGASAG